MGARCKGARCTNGKMSYVRNLIKQVVHRAPLHRVPQK
jgi:hypothetical protein